MARYRRITVAAGVVVVDVVVGDEGVQRQMGLIAHRRPAADEDRPFGSPRQTLGSAVFAQQRRLATDRHAHTQKKKINNHITSWPFNDTRRSSSTSRK